jgi:hypothetical protein
MSDDTYLLCPNCNMQSHHPDDVKFGWCAKCEAFVYAFHSQPVDLNLIINDLQKRVRYELGQGSPFSLQFEQFSVDGLMYWRALLRLGSRIHGHSTRNHLAPVDALRELDLLLEEKASRRTR